MGTFKIGKWDGGVGRTKLDTRSKPNTSSHPAT